MSIFRKCILPIFLVIPLFSSGCTLSYILHAGSGQFKLLKDSIRIEEALDSASLMPEWEEKLHLIQEIKQFGENKLGLQKTRNYETVYLKSPQAPIYMVSASPKDRLEMITWWFPIVGNIPYIGFFDYETAQKKKDQLLAKDLDVNLGMADAYSTLGWFRDPVTLNLLEGDSLDLIEIILHEMTHTTFYIKGQWEFNEGLANLIGKYGMLAFVKEKYGNRDPRTIEAMAIIDDELLFSSLLSMLLERLEELYDSPITYWEKITGRQRVFESFLEEFNRNRHEFRTERFVDFGSNELDNAYLMIISLYHKNFHIFSKVLEKKGGSIKDTLQLFIDLGNEKGNIMEIIKINFLK